MTLYSFRLGLLLFCSLLFGCTAPTPAPVSGLGKDYNKVERGSYRGSYYEVKKATRSIFIAYLTDKDVNDLISYNDLAPPYTIHPGQKLSSGYLIILLLLMVERAVQLPWLWLQAQVQVLPKRRRRQQLLKP